jgi:hypothetical protein
VEERAEWDAKLLGKRGNEDQREAQTSDAEAEQEVEGSEEKTLLDFPFKPKEFETELLSCRVVSRRDDDCPAITSRKKSMDEWESRLSDQKKKKISAVDRIIEKTKRKELLGLGGSKSLDVSVDDLLDLEYQTKHQLPRSPLGRQPAAAGQLPFSPLLTAQQMRQKRFIEHRPKSCDFAHLRLRRNLHEIEFSGHQTSVSTDKEENPCLQSKKSNSENVSEDEIFLENERIRQHEMERPSKT